MKPELRKIVITLTLGAAFMLTLLLGISCSTVGSETAKPVDSTGTILFMSYDWQSGKQEAEKHLSAIQPETGETWKIEIQAGPDAKEKGIALDISHDCRQVAYVTPNHGSSEKDMAHAIVENIDGSSHTKFIPPGPNGSVSDHLWSPDDTSLAFFSSDGKIYITDTSGSLINTVPLPSNANNTSWSPDGKRFAFVMDDRDTGNREIFVADVDGKNLINLTRNMTVNKFTVPGWQDPNQFDRGVSESNRLEEEGKLYSKPYEPKWSPDSKKLVYIVGSGVRAQHEIWVVDLVNLAHHRIWSPQAHWPWPAVDGATWSPDGKYIAFSTSSDEPAQMAGRHSSDIWIVGADGSDPHMILDGPDDQEMRGWRSCAEPPHSMGENGGV